MQDQTFLTSLSPEALQNVFSCFSDNPLANGWSSGVRFENFRRLYLDDGVLSETCRQLFPVISNLTRSHMEYTGNTEKNLQILSKKIILAAVLREGGPHITGISLNMSTATLSEVKSFLFNIEHHCKIL